MSGNNPITVTNQPFSKILDQFQEHIGTDLAPATPTNGLRSVYIPLFFGALSQTMAVTAAKTRLSATLARRCRGRHGEEGGAEKRGLAQGGGGPNQRAGRARVSR